MSRRGSGFKRLTPTEYQHKIDKGLCFRCDEAYSSGHKCQSKQLKVLLMHPEVEMEADLEEEGGEEVTSAETEMAGTGLSTASLFGIDSPRTMKILGKINGREIVVLVDGGATHCFVHPKMVQELKLPTRPKGFFVTLGDGKKVKGNGIGPELKWELQGVEFSQVGYILDIGDTDLILGVDWLSTLGDIKSNWRMQTMQFKWNDQKIILQGNPALLKREVSLRSSMKEMAAGGEGFFLEAVEGQRQGKKQPTGEGLELLLQEFENSWEDYKEILANFPEFHLEDKVRIKGGGNDKVLVTQVYTRKGMRKNRGSNPGGTPDSDLSIAQLEGTRGIRRESRQLQSGEYRLGTEEEEGRLM